MKIEPRPSPAEQHYGLRSTLNDKEVQLIEIEKENRSFQADKLRAENLLKKRTARYIESSAKAKARSAKLSRDKVSANKAKREAEDTAKKERKVSAAAKTTHKKLKVCQHVSLSLSLSFWVLINFGDSPLPL